MSSTTATKLTRSTIRTSATSSAAEAAAVSTMSAAADNNNNNKLLFLFDFDGVVCDSCDECTVSAYYTLQKLNVILSSTEDGYDYPEDWLFEKMREIRPAIEVGWQIPVLLSVFLEQQQQQQQQQPRMTVSEIIDKYEVLVRDWLVKYNLNERIMIETFGTVRDTWIQTDLNSWLAINKFYDNVPQSFNACVGKSILVTTKQQRFAIELCRYAGITSDSLPDTNIYGLGQYTKKADVIVDHMNINKTTDTDRDETNTVTNNYLPQNTYFFEDRWSTITKCLQDERLMGVQLHLCSWGYCTLKEIQLAHNEPRVTVITSLQDFVRIVTTVPKPKK